MRRDHNDLVRLQNETVEKVVDLAQRLELTPYNEEEMHSDMLATEVNVTEQEQEQEDAQHEHGTKEENVRNHTLLGVEENVTNGENIVEESVTGDAPLVGENTVLEVNVTKTYKEDAPIGHNSPPSEPEKSVEEVISDNLEMNMPLDNTDKSIDDEHKIVNASNTEEKKDEEEPISAKRNDEKEEIIIDDKEKSLEKKDMKDNMKTIGESFGTSRDLLNNLLSMQLQF